MYIFHSNNADKGQGKKFYKSQKLAINKKIENSYPNLADIPAISLGIYFDHVRAKVFKNNQYLDLLTFFLSLYVCFICGILRAIVCIN
jgi:hypothetical protein